MRKDYDFQLTGRLGRTIQMMRDLGFSQSDREAEIERNGTMENKND